MISKELEEAIKKQIPTVNSSLRLTPPAYKPATHYKDIAEDPYYHYLILIRHILKLLSDSFMGIEMGAKNIDLFMLTPSISSPMGPGSDSEAIPIKFGKLHSYLTDSSQFGFEPILMNGIDKAYCYLPSLRGEEPDKRHLNQFFHCELEIRGNLNDVMKIAEGYIKYLCEGILKSEVLVELLSASPKLSLKMMEQISRSVNFRQITFDDACETLISSGYKDLITSTEHGRDISSLGELKLFEVLDYHEPIWVTYYDRDRVPFYQKPDPEHSDKVLNADLLFPNLLVSSFGGEVLGAGQRQDTSEEMYDSLRRQALSAEPYEWYIDLRRHSNYSTTAGFGLGIERFLVWILALDNIRDVILYPRLKNVLTTP